MNEVIAKVEGKKTAKELNVYVQPENNVAYYTIDSKDERKNIQL